VCLRTLHNKLRSWEGAANHHAAAAAAVTPTDDGIE
jgi:hypothetical protein